MIDAIKGRVLLLKRSKGFTLMELVMVVVILGIVATFAIPNYTKTVSRSYERTAKNNLSIIYSAQLFSYNSGNGFREGGGLNALNSRLRIGVIDPNFTYRCGCNTGTTACTTASTQFSCTAQTIGGGGNYTLLITNMSTTPTLICCQTGTCPTTAAATGTPPVCD